MASVSVGERKHGPVGGIHGFLFQFLRPKDRGKESPGGVPSCPWKDMARVGSSQCGCFPQDSEFSEQKGGFSAPYALN